MYLNIQIYCTRIFKYILYFRIFEYVYMYCIRICIVFEYSCIRITYVLYLNIRICTVFEYEICIVFEHILYSVYWNYWSIITIVSHRKVLIFITMSITVVLLYYITCIYIENIFVNNQLKINTWSNIETVNY